MIPPNLRFIVKGGIEGWDLVEGVTYNSWDVLDYNLRKWFTFILPESVVPQTAYDVLARCVDQAKLGQRPIRLRFLQMEL